jgi:hypothetical protein
MHRSARFGCGALKNGRGRRHWAAHYPAMGLPCGLEGRLPAGFMLVRRQLGETTIYEARRSLRGGGELADPDGASDGTGQSIQDTCPNVGPSKASDPGGPPFGSKSRACPHRRRLAVRPIHSESIVLRQVPVFVHSRLIVFSPAAWTIGWTYEPFQPRRHFCPNLESEVV